MSYENFKFDLQYLKLGCSKIIYGDKRACKATPLQFASAIAKISLTACFNTKNKFKFCSIRQWNLLSNRNFPQRCY